MGAERSTQPRVYNACTSTLPARVIQRLAEGYGRPITLGQIAGEMGRSETSLYNHLRAAILLGVIQERRADGEVFLGLLPGTSVEVDHDLGMITVGNCAQHVGPMVHNWIPADIKLPPPATTAPRSIFDLGAAFA